MTSPCRWTKNFLTRLLISAGLVGGLALWAGPSPVAWGQERFPGSGFGSPSPYTSGKGELFQNNGRVKILILALSPFDITESAAEQIGLMLQKNLSNTGHYSVVGFREANMFFENERTELVDCRQIACGVESGKVLGADRVLVGSIRQTPQSIELNIRLINVANNLTDFNEQIFFTDQNMDDQMFRLANDIASSTLIVGRVLSTSLRGVVLDMGERHGLAIGDFLVVYKQDVSINDLGGKVIDFQRKNIAIVKVLRVNGNSAEAILIHSVEDPQPGHFVQTFLNPTRQTALMEDTRRELDTGIRMENKIKPLELAPVALTDNERKDWETRFLAAKAEEDTWYTYSLYGAGGAVGVLYLSSLTKMTPIVPMAAVGGAGYVVYQFLQARQVVQDIQLEGRARGYLTIVPGPTTTVAFTVKF
ncbi:MAG: hypothetical protein OEV94_01735 [Deltaproteobacteria bacterium]|nr:hypothetical protein [Deltaproteobacteria bacterium]